MCDKTSAPFGGTLYSYSDTTSGGNRHEIADMICNVLKPGGVVVVHIKRVKDEADIIPALKDKEVAFIKWQAQMFGEVIDA